MAVPVLTNEQRVAASAKAVEVRTKRAALRRQLKESKISFNEDEDVTSKKNEIKKSVQYGCSKVKIKACSKKSDNEKVSKG